MPLLTRLPCTKSRLYMRDFCRYDRIRIGALFHFLRAAGRRNTLSVPSLTLYFIAL